MIGGQGSSLTYSGDITKNYGIGQYGSIAALKGASAPADGTIVSVSGYYAAGDGGGGQFYYDSGSSATDNGGTIIEPTAGVGRWKRVYSGEVNVRWFGAKGDGVANDTAAIAAAMVPGDDVHVPLGDYLILDCQIPTTTGVRMRCDPGSRFLVNRGSAVRKAGLYFDGTSNWASPVMASSVAIETGYQSQTISKIVCDETSFSPGDICVITCNVKSTVGCCPGEMFKVLETRSGYILATRMLSETYSGNIYVRKATIIPKVAIRGATFIGNGDATVAGEKSALLRLTYANYCDVTECHFENAWNVCLLLEGGYRGKADVTFRDVPVSYSIYSYGYVVNVNAASYCVDVRVNGDKCGHAFTAGASESNYDDPTWFDFGIPFGHYVHDSVVSNSRRPPFDQHFGLFGTFDNCHSHSIKLDDEQTSSANYAFSISGLNTTINNCTGRDCRGFLVTGSKDYGVENNLRINNPNYVGTQTATSYGIVRYDAAVPALMTIIVKGGYVEVTSGDGYGDGYAGRTVFIGTTFVNCIRMFRLYAASSILSLYDCVYQPNSASNASVGRMDLSTQVLNVDNFRVITESEVSYIVDVVQAGTAIRMGRICCPTALTRFTGQTPTVTDIVTALS